MTVLCTQEIYSIKLPGDPKLGEGKPENQNHAIVFTRGEAVQTIDMNQVVFLNCFPFTDAVQVYLFIFALFLIFFIILLFQITTYLDFLILRY